LGLGVLRPSSQGTEAEYLHLLATGDFHPSLIFSDETIAEAASKSPEAPWNLRKMQA
jgi:hypothetical protein